MLIYRPCCAHRLPVISRLCVWEMLPWFFVPLHSLEMVTLLLQEFNRAGGKAEQDGLVNKRLVCWQNVWFQKVRAVKGGVHSIVFCHYLHTQVVYPNYVRWFPHSSKYLCSCLTEESHKFGTSVGWVNDDRICGWTIPLSHIKTNTVVFWRLVFSMRVGWFPSRLLPS